MLPRVMLRSALQAGQVRRNFSATAALARPDAVQQLFVDKIRDYAKQSKAAGGKLVGATPEVEKNLADQLDKINRQYGATGPDFLKFPTFTFADQTLEAPGINYEAKAEAHTHVEVAPEETAKEVEREYWQI